MNNHYGTDSTHNRYGPNPIPGDNLRREGISPGVAVTPISNYDKEVYQLKVASGNLGNTSHDASGIIKAPLAKPKAEITTTLTHQAVVKTPVNLGNQVQ